MPLLWRYLLRNYFQVFVLCVSSFISVLLVMRFQEIARFAASGASLLHVCLFTLYQIPYILPMAVPVSCLIATILLLQKLSHSHELTALRACGLSIKTIVHPLILAGCLLTLVNFTIASELAPLCRGMSKELVYKMTTLNPLLLLQKDTMIKLKDIYVEMKVLKSGKYAEDVVFVMRNSSNERLGIMTAKELTLENEFLTGNHVTFVSNIDPKQNDAFDHLIVENQRSMSTKASHLSPFIQTADWNSSYDYLPMRLLLAKMMQSKKSLSSSGWAFLEICRRSSLALGAFTFTFMGAAFGIAISRGRNKKGLLWTLGLCSFFLACFLAAKSIRHAPFMSCFFFLLPHPIIAFFSLRSLNRVSRGIE
jgi:lipopolysaccharide export system permease protein